jgi:hypothetical protein
MRFLPVVILLNLAVVCAQTAQPPGDGLHHYRAAFNQPFMRVAPRITGAPYSGEQQNDGVELAPNGSIVRNSWSEFIYRDSLGRTRTDRRMSLDPAYSQARFAQIVDPVEGYEYFVDPVNKVAHRIKIPQVSEASGTEFPTVAELAKASLHYNTLLMPKGSRETSSESLGQRSIGGILARGEQKTYTGEGSSSIRTETWMWDAMKLIVLSKRSDTSGNNSVTRLFNWSSAEPDPALFPPLAGYTVVDEERPFKIDIVVPPNR